MLWNYFQIIHWPFLAVVVSHLFFGEVRFIRSTRQLPQTFEDHLARPSQISALDSVLSRVVDLRCCVPTVWSGLCTCSSQCFICSPTTRLCAACAWRRSTLRDCTLSYSATSSPTSFSCPYPRPTSKSPSYSVSVQFVSVLGTRFAHHTVVLHGACLHSGTIGGGGVWSQILGLSQANNRVSMSNLSWNFVITWKRLLIILPLFQNFGFVTCGAESYFKHPGRKQRKRFGRSVISDLLFWQICCDIRQRFDPLSTK